MSRMSPKTAGDLTEVSHWRGLRDKYLNDARLLLKYGRDCGAMLMMCSLMDAASGLYTGRTSGGRVGDSFREFILKYMPQFGNIRFGDSLCKDKNVPVRDALDMLWFCYRNGLVHEGHLPTGMKLVRDARNLYLFGVQAPDKMTINVSGMLANLAKAAAQFERDLLGDEALRAKYRARLEYLQRVRFVTDPSVARPAT